MRAVFICGAARSGTTLLGSLLGGHPACVTTPESNFKVDTLIPCSQKDGTVEPPAVRSLLENLRFRSWELELIGEDVKGLERAGTVRNVMFLLARAYARARGHDAPSMWVDHTPSNARYVDRLWKHFPESKFIHLIRDGRAVSASILPLHWGPNTIVAAASFWMEAVAAGLGAESRIPKGNIQRVRFEDLVRDPKGQLRELCDFLQIDFRETMVAGDGFQPESYTQSIHPLIGQPPKKERISAWQDKLKARDIELFEARTGDLLECLGYELKYGWKARGASFGEMLSMYLKEGGLRARNKAIFRERRREYVRTSQTALNLHSEQFPRAS